MAWIIKDIYTTLQSLSLPTSFVAAQMLHIDILFVLPFPFDFIFIALRYYWPCPLFFVSSINKKNLDDK